MKKTKEEFNIRDIGQNGLLCLDPYDDAFLLIRTIDETYYMFSMKDSAELEKIYKTLESRN